MREKRMRRWSAVLLLLLLLRLCCRRQLDRQEGGLQARCEAHALRWRGLGRRALARVP